MQAVTHRMGTHDDAPFLARMDYEASTPPFEHSMWDELIAPTGTDPLVFLEAQFRHDASNWGNAEDFVILELDGQPMACCAVFRPKPDRIAEGSLNLDKLPLLAEALGWSDEVTQAFRAGYEKVWNGSEYFMQPQADVIIETVAVAPEARGKGLGHSLMTAAFDRGRQMGASSIGIMAIIGNDNAHALYQKHFKPYATFHSAYFDDAFPGVTKYRAALTD